MFCGIVFPPPQLINEATQTVGEISTKNGVSGGRSFNCGDELRRFSFPGEAPSLQVKFSGDLSQFETARAEATLRGDRVQRGSYEMRGLAIAAEWTNQTLEIKQCEWADNAGSFSGRTSWSRETNEADFQARSTLDAKQFLGAFGFGQLLTDLALSSPPVIELSGSGNFAGLAPRVSVIGSAVLENFAFRTVPFLKLSGDFSWNGKRGMLRGLRLRHDSGELTADLLEAPMISLHLEAAAIHVLARACVRLRFLGEWEWPRPRRATRLRGPTALPRRGRGRHRGASAHALRVAWMNSAKAMSTSIRCAPFNEFPRDPR